MRIYIDIAKCNECPFVVVKRTEGAGYAEDFYCGKNKNKKIAGYVEYASEMPKEPPEWCPFRK